MTAARRNVRALTPKVTAEIVNVTPEMAEQWLASNIKNRRIRPRLVARYARDKAAGNWAVTGEDFKYAANGNLLDGQHRLRAVTDSGASVPMLVVTGLPEDVQDVMDTGASRTASDALGLRGVKNPAIVGAAVRLAVAERQTAHWDNFVATHREVIEFLAANPTMEDAAYYAAFAYKRVECPPAIIAYSLWRFCEIDSAAAYDFWDGLVDKVGLTAGDPRIPLMHRLSQAKRSGEHISREGHVSAIFRSWNLWRAGEKADRLHINSRKGGVIPVPVPR